MYILTSINQIILLLTLTANFGLGIYIYLKDPKSHINRVFSQVMFMAAFWAASMLIFSSSNSLDWMLFWRRLTPVGSALVGGYFLYFALIFPKEENPLPAKIRTLIFFPGIAFALLSIFTPWMIKDFVITNPEALFLGKPIFGFIYRLYSIYLVLFFSVAIFVLTRKHMKSTGREKLQLFYVLFGMASSVILGVILSLILPILGMTQLFTFGPSFTLVMAWFISYAIIRYRLLNIEDFLSRGLFFIFAFLFFIGTFYFWASGNLKFLLVFYITSINFFIGLLVFSQNWRAKLNQTFFVFAFCLAGWTFGLTLFQSVGGLLWARLAHVFASFIPPVFLSFENFFPREEKENILLSYFVYIIGIVFAALSFTDLMVVTTYVQPWGFGLEMGKAYPFFAFFFLCVMSLIFIRLSLKYNKSSGINKIQIVYVFFGTLLTAAISIISAILLPLFGFARWYYLAPPSTFIMVAFIAYSIARHNLMSIELVFQKGFIYSVITIIIAAIYGFTVLVSEKLFRGWIGYNSGVLIALIAFFVAIGYQPFFRWLQVVSDKLFLRGKYDYRKTIQEVSQAIASLVSIEQVVGRMVFVFLDAMKVSEVSILLIDREIGRFRSVTAELSGEQKRRYKKIEIDKNSPIILLLSRNFEVVSYDEIRSEMRLVKDYPEEVPRYKLLSIASEEIVRIGMSIWVPIVSRGEMVGVISLGEKLSGEGFTSEDLELLKTLSSQTAIALDNTKLYDQLLGMKNYVEDVLKSMTNGIITTDLSGNIVVTNHMAERILGFSEEELKGRNVTEVWKKGHPIVEVVDKTLKDRCFTNYEISLQHPLKGFLPASLNTTLLRDSRGKRIGALVSISDLTEVKGLEAKVRRADKLAALGTMAAGMAHEIKNPLSSMKVLSQLMPIKFDDPEFRKQFQEIMPREVNRIDKIVESLLGFARASAPKFEVINISALLDETIEYFDVQLKSNNVSIVKQYGDLPDITADGSQLSQVFSNLISNGIQSMPNGGQLKIITKEGEKKEGLVDKIEVLISDTGMGISNEDQRKLFDPFFSTKHGGTGLGLTITHSIIEAHKGGIDFKSEVGKGTTFTVGLPVTQ